MFLNKKKFLFSIKAGRELKFDEIKLTAVFQELSTTPSRQKHTPDGIQCQTILKKCWIRMFLNLIFGETLRGSDKGLCRSGVKLANFSVKVKLLTN